MLWNIVIAVNSSLDSNLYSMCECSLFYRTPDIFYRQIAAIYRLAAYNTLGNNSTRSTVEKSTEIQYKVCAISWQHKHTWRISPHSQNEYKKIQLIMSNFCVKCYENRVIFLLLSLSVPLSLWLCIWWCIIITAGMAVISSGTESIVVRIHCWWAIFVFVYMQNGSLSNRSKIK